MAEKYKSYDDLLHTRQVSNRTYTYVIGKHSMQVNADGEVITTIRAEGAWKLELCWTGDEDQCFLTFGDNAEEISILGNGASTNNWGGNIWSFGGDPNTCRDDIIGVRLIGGIGNFQRLIVVRHVIVFKQDDEYYPAVASSRQELAELNAGEGKTEG